MRLLVLSGAEHSFVRDRVSKKRHTVVNKCQLTLRLVEDYLRDYPLSDYKILVTDGALLPNPDENGRIIQALSEQGIEIVVVTRDFLFSSAYDNVRVFISDWFRATDECIEEALKPQPTEVQVSKNEKKWRSKAKKKVETDEFSPVSNIERASSRIMVFTGRRGCGVTSTAVNVALSAVNRKLKTIFLDLDIDYRAANLYFGEFVTQADKHDDISSSLIRMLAQPQKYDIFTANIGGLRVSSLGYGFTDEKLIAQHFNETKLIGLLTSLKHCFDLVVVDFPLHVLARFPASLNNIDSLAVCMENNIYSAFTTVRSAVLGFEEEGNISYFASKAQLVATKYNDETVYDGEPITPERLSELVVNEGFCDDFTAEMPVAGFVPYEKRFDEQIERDVSIIYTDSRMRQAYDSILLRLLGAFK